MTDDDKAWLTTYHMLHAQGLINADGDKTAKRYPRKIAGAWIMSDLRVSAIGQSLDRQITQQEFQDIRRIFFAKAYCND